MNIRYKGWRLHAYVLGVWIAASILVGSVYPAAVQAFQVAPNELNAEKPYIKLNIKGTRAGFALNNLDVRSFPAANNLTPTDDQEASATHSNVPLLCPHVEVQAYKQLHRLRKYYA